MTAAPHGLKYFVVKPDTVLIQLHGNWKESSDRGPALEALETLHSKNSVHKIEFDTRQMGAWNSALLTYLIEIDAFCKQNGIEMIRTGLPHGVARLLALALAVPEKKDARSVPKTPSLTEKVGHWTLVQVQNATETVGFIGEVSLACLQMVRGTARLRASDLMLFMQQCGAQALPIVTLISLLVGLILAFVGAVQLQMFGAQIYVANLVGLAMAREMGAMMAGITLEEEEA